MVIPSVAALMVKILSPSVLLTRAAIAWIRTGGRQAATVPTGRGVLRLRLQLLHPLVTPRVARLCPPVLDRISTSSHRSSGLARRPCRTGGSGVIFAGSSGGAGEEAVQLEKKLVELEKKLVEHRLRRSANKSSFTFCYVIDITKGE